MPARKPRTRGKKVAAQSTGLNAPDTASVPASRQLDDIAEAVTTDGGAVLARYRDPVGGKPLLLVSLPIERVEPTPYQRDASDAHVKRLMGVVREDRPLPRSRSSSSARTTGTGRRTGTTGCRRSRSSAIRAVTALLVPDPDVAFKILALNTEKAHNLREKSLETIRMARALAADAATRTEASFAFEFEQPSFLTLGVVLRGAAAFQRRRVPVDSAQAPTTSSTSPIAQGAQGTRAPRAEDPEAGRRRQRRRREAEGEGADQSVPEVVRRRARELHALLEGDVDRLRRDARQDHRERAEVQRRARQAGGRREGGRRAGRRAVGTVISSAATP